MSKPKPDEKCKRCKELLTYIPSMMGYGCRPCNRVVYPDEANEANDKDDVQ